MNSVGFYKSCVGLMQFFCLFYICFCAVFVLSKDNFLPCGDKQVFEFVN